ARSAFARVRRGVRRAEAAARHAAWQVRAPGARVVLRVPLAGGIAPSGARPAHRNRARAGASLGGARADAVGAAGADRRGAPLVAGADKRPVGAHYGLRDWLSQRVTAV